MRAGPDGCQIAGLLACIHRAAVVGGWNRGTDLTWEEKKMLKVIVNYTNGTKTEHVFSDVLAAYRYATTLKVLEWVKYTNIAVNNEIVATYNKKGL